MRYTSPNPDAPSIGAIELAVERMNAPGAPTFPDKREKRLATVELAEQIWRTGTPIRRVKLGSAAGDLRSAADDLRAAAGDLRRAAGRLRSAKLSLPGRVQR